MALSSGKMEEVWAAVSGRLPPRPHPNTAREASDEDA